MYYLCTVQYIVLIYIQFTSIIIYTDIYSSHGSYSSQEVPPLSNTPKKGVTHCTGIPLPLPRVLGLAKKLTEALSLESVNILLNTVLEGSPLA